MNTLRVVSTCSSPWSAVAVFARVRALRFAFVSTCCVAFTASCGAVEDAEMFLRTSEALSKNVGQTCESFPVTSESEVNVDDHDESCAPAFCVTKGGVPGAAEGQGVCSCRCAGPAGTGPFCRCGQGFQCQHLIEDVGFDTQHLAGSYCMPR